MNRPRQIWPCIVATVIALPMLYVASLGPVNWAAGWLYHWGCWPDFATLPLDLYDAPLEWLVRQLPATLADSVWNQIVLYEMLYCPKLF